MADECPHDQWFVTVQQVNHNGHPPEATCLLRKPSRLHSTADLELVSAALASYGGSGMARSLNVLLPYRGGVGLFYDTALEGH